MEKRKARPEHSPLSYALSPTEFATRLLRAPMPVSPAPKCTPPPDAERVAAYTTVVVRAAQAIDAAASLTVLQQRGELKANACNQARTNERRLAS